MARTRTMIRPRVATDREVPDRDGNQDGEPSDDEQAPPRRGRRRLVVGAVLATVTAVVAATVARGGGSDDAASTTASTATAPVELRTLTQTERIDATLDFGESRGVAAGAAGTVTDVAADGSTVDRGEALFSIDQHPTVLLVGAIPLYRDLTEGIDDGQDVAQLEDNLAELGYTDDGAMIVDGHFDASTTDAVEAWQSARGVEVTGSVTRADAVFLPGRARIADAALDLGASVQQGTTVVSYTRPTRVVRAQIEPSQADLVHVDDKVTITLPDGTEVPGTVATVAGTTSSGDGSDGSGEAGSGSEDTTTIDVTITLDDQAPAEAYTTASVDVELTGSQREDVLAVPVTALLALAGTGYALEVPQEDGTTDLVPVEPGMYADGYVEVSGDGIDEGTEVVVAEP